MPNPAPVATPFTSKLDRSLGLTPGSMRGDGTMVEEPASKFPFRTYRIEIQGTGRVLVTGFSSPAPSFRADPRKEAAEFSNEATAIRVARKLESDMAERTRAMGLPDPATLVVVQAVWDDKGIEAWDAVQRLDRTSVEVGRFEANYLPFSIRAKS